MFYSSIWIASFSSLSLPSLFTQSLPLLSLSLARSFRLASSLALLQFLYQLWNFKSNTKVFRLLSKLSAETNCSGLCWRLQIRSGDRGFGTRFSDVWLSTNINWLYSQVKVLGECFLLCRQTMPNKIRMLYYFICRKSYTLCLRHLRMSHTHTKSNDFAVFPYVLSS